MKSEAAEAPHPRQGERLQRIEAQAQALEGALARGRLHHAWLLTGPQGIGKASFAYRAAQRLLGARPDPAFGPLGHAPDDAVGRLVAAQTHPDLMVLERQPDGVAARKVIPVDDARRLPEFFSKAPAIAACRVAIIDAADDLNVNAANAVLKTLEEPSGRGVLFLISHAPGRLLPTLRSRCRRLAFPAWPLDALETFARERLDVDDEVAIELAAMAHGAPGRLLSLASGGALEIDRAAAGLLDGSVGPQADAEALRLAEGFRGADGGRSFALLLERLGDRLRLAALQSVGARAEALAGLWRRVAQLPGQVEALNLDRADAFWSLRAELRRALGAG